MRRYRVPDARGGASKDLELVEFADFQCPHCKEAQPTIDKIHRETVRVMCPRKSFDAGAFGSYFAFGTKVISGSGLP